MSLDHSLVRAASRRAHAPFTLTERRRPLPIRRPSAKLTAAEVTAIRSWSKAEGFGYARKAQARALTRRFPVSSQTLYDVLANNSWFDPTYDASTPDRAFWAGATPLRVVLQVLAGR